MAISSWHRSWPLLLAMAVPCVSAQSQPSSSDALLRRNLAATCANCHGTNGHARGEVHALAGRPAAEIASLMAEFKGGKREATVMHQIAKGYSDEQIQLMAAYFAAQPQH